MQDGSFLPKDRLHKTSYTLGGNDFLRRKPSKRVKEDIREIIQTVVRFGAQTALVSVPELSLLGALAGKPLRLGHF